MNWDQVEGKWKQVKGSIKQKWGKLTDDDLDYIAGAVISLPANYKSGMGSPRKRLRSALTSGSRR